MQFIAGRSPSLHLSRTNLEAGSEWVSVLSLNPPAYHPLKSNSNK